MPTELGLINKREHSTNITTWWWSPHPANDRHSMKLEWLSLYKQSLAARHLRNIFVVQKWRENHSPSLSRQNPKLVSPLQIVTSANLCAAENRTIGWIHYSVCCWLALWHRGTHFLIWAHMRRKGNLKPAFTPLSTCNHFLLRLSHFRVLWTWQRFVR